MSIRNNKLNSHLKNHDSVSEFTKSSQACSSASNTKSANQPLSLSNDSIVEESSATESSLNPVLQKSLSRIASSSETDDGFSSSQECIFFTLWNNKIIFFNTILFYFLAIKEFYKNIQTSHENLNQQLKLFKDRLASATKLPSRPLDLVVTRLKDLYAQTGSILLEFENRNISITEVETAIEPRVEEVVNLQLDRVRSRHPLNTEQQSDDLKSTDGFESISRPTGIFYLIPSDIVAGRRLIYRYYISKTGFLYSEQSGRQLQGSNKSGYRRVKLQDGTPEGFSVYIHRLVALMFLKNELRLPEVRHRDGNKSNNVLSNLQWISHDDNTAFTNGLPISVVDVIRNQIIAEFVSIRACCLNYHLNEATFRSDYLNKDKLFRDKYVFESLKLPE